jgi:hypothetical protein
MGFPPPFAGVAENVTDAPGQNGFCDAVIETPTGRLVLTDAGYWMLDAGLFVVHTSEEVRITETISPFIGT